MELGNRDRVKTTINTNSGTLVTDTGLDKVAINTSVVTPFVWDEPTNN
jgi:hypothetical protein